MSITARLRANIVLRQSIPREDSISLELQEQAGRQHCTQRNYEALGV